MGSFIPYRLASWREGNVFLHPEGSTQRPGRNGKDPAAAQPSPAWLLSAGSAPRAATRSKTNRRSEVCLALLGVCLEAGRHRTQLQQPQDSGFPFPPSESLRLQPRRLQYIPGHSFEEKRLPPCAHRGLEGGGARAAFAATTRQPFGSPPPSRVNFASLCLLWNGAAGLPRSCRRRRHYCGTQLSPRPSSLCLTHDRQKFNRGSLCGLISCNGENR